MWPSFDTAAHISQAAHWALIASLAVGLVSAALLMWTGKLQKADVESDRQATQATIGKLGAAVAEANARATQAANAVAEANAKAAEASSAVMQANARATEAEAALALAKFRSPRTLTTEQQSRIADKLRAVQPSPYDVAVADGAEPAALTKRIEEVLKQAKWVARDQPAGAAGSIGTDGFISDGVSVEIAESRRADWEPAVIALVLALRAEGIYANGTANARSDPSAIHVMVGSKPQDQFVAPQPRQAERREEATQGAH